MALEPWTDPIPQPPPSFLGQKLYSGPSAAKKGRAPPTGLGLCPKHDSLQILGLRSLLSHTAHRVGDPIKRGYLRRPEATMLLRVGLREDIYQDDVGMFC